jgi:hypothetical protein
MRRSEMTREKLLALFARKATEPPTEANQILVRHLKCKESVHLALAVSEAMNRYSGTDNQSLAAPSELLAPLG